MKSPTKQRDVFQKALAAANELRKEAGGWKERCRREESLRKSIIRRLDHLWNDMQDTAYYAGFRGVRPNQVNKWTAIISNMAKCLMAGPEDDWMD